MVRGKGSEKHLSAAFRRQAINEKLKDLFWIGKFVRFAL
jgi:hypothetical protein